jgi:hypothetical protein
MTEILALLIGLIIGWVVGVPDTDKYVMVPAMRKALANSGYTIEDGKILPIDA